MARNQKYLIPVFIYTSFLIVGISVEAVLAASKMEMAGDLKYSLMTIAQSIKYIAFVLAVFGGLWTGILLAAEQDEASILKLELEKLKKDNRFSNKTLDELHTVSQDLLINHIKNGGRK